MDGTTGRTNQMTRTLNNTQGRNDNKLIRRRAQRMKLKVKLMAKWSDDKVIGWNMVGVVTTGGPIIHHTVHVPDNVSGCDVVTL